MNKVAVKLVWTSKRVTQRLHKEIQPPIDSKLRKAAGDMCTVWSLGTAIDPGSVLPLCHFFLFCKGLPFMIQRCLP